MLLSWPYLMQKRLIRKKLQILTQYKELVPLNRFDFESLFIILFNKSLPLRIFPKQTLFFNSRLHNLPRKHILFWLFFKRKKLYINPHFSKRLSQGQIFFDVV